MKRKIIRWTTPELSRLVDDVALLRLQEPGPSLVTLINRAQVGLPEDRRRYIHALAQVPGFPEEVARVLHLMTFEPRHGEPRKQTLGEAAASVFDRLEELLNRWEKGPTTPPPRPPSPPPPPRPQDDRCKPRKLVIAVIGLLANQAADLTNRVKHLPVDLRCVSKELRVPTFPAGANEVLLFTKFITHGWQDAAYNTFGREHVHAHHGGVEKAAELIALVVKARVSKSNGVAV